MNIREATPQDQPAIETLLIQAFGEQEGPEVATLVNDLLEDTTARPLLSLVAVEGKNIVGNIIFSNAFIAEGGESLSVQLLAPLAVAPDYQGKGIGTLLINEGLAQLEKSGVDLVFVLGHPEYYPRCGFKTAGILGFDAPYPIPEKVADAWMVLELKEGLIGKIKGTVKCAESMNKPEYWRE